MNKTIHILVIVFLITIPVLADEGVLVNWVDDGDTIYLSTKRHVRYIGINAPEVEHKGKQHEIQKAEPFGSQARDYNKILVHKKKIFLEMDTEAYDRYGRLLAYVFLDDGRFINEMMLKKGYAYCLPQNPNTRHEQRFLKAQQDAMDHKRGIWQNITEKEDNCIGNIRSKRFHLPSCPFGRMVKGKNKREFNSRWDAFYNGFAPCRKCN